MATAELKNPLTNQTVEHAVAQYRRRDPKHALFRFKTRALVHFAVDPDLVYMTTKLAGEDTRFLPFNRGNDRGAGNPEHPSGYRTGYLWQEVWQRDSFLDVLGRFVHLEVEERKTPDGKTRTTESVIFPRYHQLDVVRQLEAAARVDGAGKNYLVQHSAGSGKSNSIAWLAHRLSSLHDDKDERVFDSVVVVTDPKVLDQQLQDNIYQFEHKQGVVQKIDENSQQLDTDDFQVLLVANKYQTGFDQPLLHTMYVDKRLSGVQAVQTLSRLNRMATGKEDTFVLDFVNDADEIQRSFQPYYEQTVVAESADPHQLYELQHRLEAMQVFWSNEVETFCKFFYAPKAKQTVTDQAEMYRALNPAVDRFKALDEDKQEEFRNALAGYVRLYAFLSQVMPFADADLERLYTFARFLELKLPKDEKKAPLNLDGDVALKYYRLDKISEGQIVLSLAEPVALRAPTDVGTRKATDEEVALSEIINVLNDRFGTEFTKADQLLFDQFIEEATQDKEIVERALANPLDNFELAMKPKVEGLMIDRMDQNQDIVNRYLNDPAFQSAAFKAIVKQIYDQIRRGSTRPPPPP